MSPYGPPNAHAPICDTKKQVLGLWDMSHIMSCTHLDQVAYISGSHHLTSKLIFPSPSSLEQVWVVKMVPKSRNSNSCNSQICQPHGGPASWIQKLKIFWGTLCIHFLVAELLQLEELDLPEIQNISRSPIDGCKGTENRKSSQKTRLFTSHWSVTGSCATFTSHLGWSQVDPYPKIQWPMTQSWGKQKSIGDGSILQCIIKKIKEHVDFWLRFLELNEKMQKNAQDN